MEPAGGARERTALRGGRGRGDGRRARGGRDRRASAGAGSPRHRRGARRRRPGRGRPCARRTPLGPEAAVPPDRGEPRVVGRPALGRGHAGRDPARAAQPARPRAQPLPRLRRHVGRLGRLRPGGVGLLRHGEARRGGRRGRPRGGDELRRLPRAHRAVHQGRRRERVALRVRRPHGRAVLSARRHDHRRRLPGRGRQPDRGEGHRGGARRRLERGDRVRRPRLQAGQPAAPRRLDGDARRWSTRTAGSRCRSST